MDQCEERILFYRARHGAGLVADMRRVYNVQARWDSEGGVWVAQSEDVTGFAAEGESPNVLARKVRVLIPEHLELDGALEAGDEPIEFVVRYEAVATARV